MSFMIPIAGHIFQYGFLASNVCIILSIYENEEDYQLSLENKDLLKRAATYVDGILSSQQLVSGTRGHMAPPSVCGLKAFKYAVNSLPQFYQEAIDSSEKREDLFRRIRSVLDDMATKPKSDINRNELNVASNFFGTIAKLYLKEAERRFRHESSSHPKLT